MSWIKESSLNIFQRLCLQIMRSGHVPRHIAFIMDGNRRFANKTNVGKSEGHAKGFDKLSEVLRWCLDLGMKEVTVYAFSIENFKRSKDEVDALLDLARHKFRKLLEEKDKLMKEGVNIRVIGNVSLLPMDLQQLIAEAVNMTRTNQSLRLNVAFAYTSRDEMTAAIHSVVQGVAEGVLEPTDVTPYVLEKALYTEDGPPPDLLIRTSGEVRLSDFMLWQCSSCCIYFTPALWPEFTLWDLLKGIFHYQRSYNTLQGVKAVDRSVMDSSPRVDAFLQDLYTARLNYLTALLTNQ